MIRIQALPLTSYLLKKVFDSGNDSDPSPAPPALLRPLDYALPLPYPTSKEHPIYPPPLRIIIVIHYISI